MLVCPLVIPEMLLCDLASIAKGSKNNNSDKGPPSSSPWFFVKYQLVEKLLKRFVREHLHQLQLRSRDEGGVSDTWSGFHTGNLINACRLLHTHTLSLGCF